jgi:hypothetical protein
VRVVQCKDDSVSEPFAKAISAQPVPSDPDDETFLEGPRSRFEEFFTLLRVMRDFLRGFRTLHFVGPCVTIFGSARISPVIRVTSWREKWVLPLRVSDSLS